jgi:hypothetical protein
MFLREMNYFCKYCLLASLRSDIELKIIAESRQRRGNRISESNPRLHIFCGFFWHQGLRSLSKLEEIIKYRVSVRNCEKNRFFTKLCEKFVY